MAPLYYMFRHKNTSLDDLDKVCNVGKVLKTVPKRMIFSRSTVQDSIQKIQDVYVVPKNNVNVKKAILEGMRDRLNAILDEFTPEFSMDTSFQYIQVMDCSLALYNMIQEHTKCSDQNSNAFCSDYAKESKYTSGLYYFLDYTMVEVPFAWWHKCMLMKGRTFASQNVRTKAVIQCDEWYKDTIKESMLNLTNYKESDVLKKLQRLEGGITSRMVEQQIVDFKKRLSNSVHNFVNGGQLSVEKSSNVFVHKGVPSSFNMMCFSQTRFPSNLTRYKTQTKPDCILGMLDWIHNEDSDAYLWPKFNSLGPFSKAGAEKSCYSLDKKDLVPMTFDDGLTAPFTFILKRTVGQPANPRDVLDDAPLYDGIVFNNFFQGDYNDRDGGMLISEFNPSNPPSSDETQDALPDDLFRLTDVLDPVVDILKFEKFFSMKSYPCVKIQDIEKRLPSCTPTASAPVKLNERHCNTMRTKLIRIVSDYSKKINKYPSTFPETRWPPASYTSELSLDCIWDCGETAGKNKPVHIGLSKNDTDYMSVLIDQKWDYCKSLVRAGASMYRDPDMQTSSNTTSELVRNLQESDSGFVIQELCRVATYKILNPECVDSSWGCPGSGIVEMDEDPSTYGSDTKLGSFFDSIFSSTSEPLIVSKTFSTKASKNYKCMKVAVRSTGSEVVDTVRSSLSYDDIVVSMNDLSYRKQDVKKKEKFLEKIFSIMSQRTDSSIMNKDESSIQRCISVNPPFRNEEGDYVDTRVISTDFYVASGPEKGCLRLNAVAGFLDCR